MPYPTVAEARAAQVAAAGATDAQVQAALDGAVALVEYATRDSFVQATQTVAALLDGGVAYLPRRVGTVTGVRVEGASADVPSTSYTVTSSSVLGQTDAVRLLTGDTWRALVGFTTEPVRTGPLDGVPVTVTGTFGWATTPEPVRQAVLLLAADSLDGLGLGGAAGSSAVNTEGDVDLPPRRVPEPVLTPSGTDTARTGRTTGNATADGLLAPYVRARLVMT